MNSLSSRLLKTPTIATSASTPNLTQLERKFSLNHSSDALVPRNISISCNLATLEEETGNGPISVVPTLQLRGGSEMISSSAPGSLQSSPRNKSPSAPHVPLVATPETVDRPRTLPPKNAAELQKHIKEYEEISKQIKKSMEKEAKDKQKKENLKSSREKKLVEFRKVWVEEVLPNWEKNTRLSPERVCQKRIRRDSKKVQDMWRVGLPPSVRGQIWRHAIGNELMITKELFDISIGHAQQTKETMFGSPQIIVTSVADGATPPKAKAGRGESFVPVQMDELLGKEGTVALVTIMDLPMDFPARELFVADGPMHKQMAEVLEAYVAYRPDVGYAPCMSYLVAGFLLNMETLDTFISLANFINKPFNLAFYITDRSQMYKYTIVADSIISTLLPKIHKHFKEINIEPELFLGDWFMTIFLKPLPLDIASRVWDIYFLEGEIFLFKVMLALLKMHSHQFESYPRDLCVNILNKFPKDISEESLFEHISQFNLDPKKFYKLLET